jgi:hypothetical protein
MKQNKASLYKDVLDCSGNALGKGTHVSSLHSHRVMATGPRPPPVTAAAERAWRAEVWRRHFWGSKGVSAGGSERDVPDSRPFR